LIGNIKLWYIEFMNDVASHNLILTKYFPKVKIKGSSFVSPALGWAGQGRLNKNNFPPPKNREKSKRTDEKEGGLGEGIFARPLCPPKAGWGWEAARPCVSKEAKPAKIVSLIGKEFCTRPLKEKEIFAGFVRRQAASRWAGLPREAGQLFRVLLEMSSNFFQQTPPKFICRLARGFAPRFGGHFGKIIPRLFERDRQCARRKAAVRADGFSFAFSESQNEILLNY
jgi:hypothetical protein